MRERKVIITAIAVAVILIALIIGVTIHIDNMREEYQNKYKSATDVYLHQIDEIGSKKELESILKDSLPVWREKDREMIADHLEELQFYIDEYNDIRTMPKEKVDRVYRSALEELVRKYRNDELKPTE